MAVKRRRVRGSGRRRCEGRRRSSHRRPVHDQHGHRRQSRHRQSGDGAGPRRLGTWCASPSTPTKQPRRCPRSSKTLDKFGVRVPIIGDFHYNGHLLLKKYPDCAARLAKYRINPGNVNIGKKHDDNFRTMIEAAIEYDRPVRIGVNWGSLDQALLTRMMDENSLLPEPKDAREVTLEAMRRSARSKLPPRRRHYGLGHDKIILSAKVSGVQDLIDVYRAAGRRNATTRCTSGLTEAGLGAKGIRRHYRGPLRRCCRRASRDTIRASLRRCPTVTAPKRWSSRQQILQSLGIRSFTPRYRGRPGCGRTTSTFLPGHGRPDPDLSPRPDAGRGVEEMRVAVIVNGPGESKHANRHLTAGYVRPQSAGLCRRTFLKTLKGDRIVAEFIEILNEYVATRY